MHAKSLLYSLLLVGAHGTSVLAEVDSSLPGAAERSTSMLPALAVLAIMVVLRVKLRLYWEQTSSAGGSPRAPAPNIAGTAHRK